MSEVDEGIRGIILAHGSMAQGMASAIHQIAGVGEEALVALSNEGKGPDQILAELDEASGTRRTIIFTDLFTGSCALSARKACLHTETRRVVFGANLPMLLDFVFHRTDSLDELVPRLVAKGRDAVQALPTP
jgi:mannose/fructose-specific phosphotransferase system component IIA